MDVPCPDCNSTDLQKVFLAREEVHRCDKPAQFRGVLVGSSGSELLARTSITKGTKQTVLTAPKRWSRDMSNLQQYYSALVLLPDIPRSHPRRDGRFWKSAGRTPGKSCGG